MIKSSSSLNKFVARNILPFKLSSKDSCCHKKQETNHITPRQRKQFLWFLNEYISLSYCILFAYSLCFLMFLLDSINVFLIYNDVFLFKGLLMFSFVTIYYLFELSKKKNLYEVFTVQSPEGLLYKNIIISLFKYL